MQIPFDESEGSPDPMPTRARERAREKAEHTRV